MPTDKAERALVRLIILAVIVFCVWAIARNALAVSVDATHSVPVYWCAMFFILVASVFSLAWSWHDFQIALSVFGWSTLIGITAMALYDAHYTNEVWNGLIYVPAVVGVGLMSFFIGGRHAVIYGMMVTITALLEGIAYQQNIHALAAVGLTWGVWAGTWVLNHRFGRLERRIVQLEGANDIYSGFILGEMESEV